MDSMNIAVVFYAGMLLGFVFDDILDLLFRVTIKTGILCLLEGWIRVQGENPKEDFGHTTFYKEQHASVY